MNQYSLVILSVSIICANVVMASDHSPWSAMKIDPQTVLAESQLPASTKIWRVSFFGGKGAHSGVILWRMSDRLTVALEGRQGWASSSFKGTKAANIWNYVEDRTRQITFHPQSSGSIDADLGWCLLQYTTPPKRMSIYAYVDYVDPAQLRGCVTEPEKAELDAIFHFLQNELGVPVPADH